MAQGGIIVLKNNAPWGPFNAAQIREGLGRGDFTLQYLAHAPGLKDWLPLGEVLHRLEEGSVTPAPAPPARQLPPLPRKEVAAGTASSPPPMPAVAPVRPPALPPGLADIETRRAQPPRLPEAVPADARATAPVLRRFQAWVIDCAILFVPILVLFGAAWLAVELQGILQRENAESLRQSQALLRRNFNHLMLFVALGLGWIYGAGLESSRWQGTVGKQWMRLVVADRQGGRLSFLQATQRHFAKYLSALPLFLGFISALFSAQRLAWHDRLAGTRVLQSPEKNG